MELYLITTLQVNTGYYLDLFLVYEQYFSGPNRFDRVYTYLSLDFSKQLTVSPSQTLPFFSF